MSTPATRLELRVGRQLAQISSDIEAMSPDQCRTVVDIYYEIQRLRIAANAQHESSEVPVRPLASVATLMRMNEDGLQSILGAFAKRHREGRWALSQCGIGPVITAGLLAHIKPERAPTAGALWRFAGLDPGQEWLGTEKARKAVVELLGRSSGAVTVEEVASVVEALKGRLNTYLFWMTKKGGKAPTMTVASLCAAAARRPHNASLKRLAWLVGESFVKVSGNENAFYGRLWAERKAYETAQNEEGAYAAEAARLLAEKNYGDSETRRAMEGGKLSKGHTHARSKRWTVKLFLSHYWQVAREVHGLPILRPWVIEHGGHQDYVPPPSWPCE